MLEHNRVGMPTGTLHDAAKANKGEHAKVAEQDVDDLQLRDAAAQHATEALAGRPHFYTQEWVDLASAAYLFLAGGIEGEGDGEDNERAEKAA